ncbi:hypothetical protein Rxyl_1925 [Rubrobacter xylanophilus DSM 9941]|uniref:Uncharacterized protein n=1 Tax=Rubrobacter xylanophilus (strain DSM 9941 / JCM 11954 / NBRC 16129 / PRD-1) TaxID=266117 RepID=Q1AUQ6_RUBXD|nr:hypothetical protein [Rubrobacter xylanophilus]ABG04872.1 hypothetical protein Rxyl_1925 [Rubrobacter xylanophilus DSM 9941]
MSEAVDREPGRPGDEDIERAVVESLKVLDRDGRLAVLEFSRSLERKEGRPKPGAISLLEEWMADESGYAEETLPELEKAIDRDRLGYRKLFE